MKFIASPNSVTIENGGFTLTIPIADWLLFEPDFEYDATADFEQWTPELHYKVVGGNQQAAGLPSRQIYCDAIATYQPVIEPPPPPPGPVPQGREFRRLLLGDPLFGQWQVSLPAIGREDLKLAAIADDWESCQIIYNGLKAAIALPNGAAELWQGYADTNIIPLTF